MFIRYDPNINYQFIYARLVYLTDFILCFSFQQGTLVTVLLIVPLQYSAKEAFSRISQIEQSYVDTVGEEKIRQSATFIISAGE